MKPILEICCSSLEGCIEANKNGGDRIELCGSMSAGGLTPSLGLFRLAKKHCSIPIAVMIRPRGTGFCYDEQDIITMKEDAKIFLEEGADAIVFGCLTADRKIDKENVQAFCDLAHSYGKEAAFHKAIDDTEDLLTEINTLYELGIDRVLTSGGKGVANDNIDILKNIVVNFGDKMQILIGGGIRSNNVEMLLNETKAKQVHSACRKMRQDASMHKAESLTYDNAYDTVLGEEVKRMSDIMQTMRCE